MTLTRTVAALAATAALSASASVTVVQLTGPQPADAAASDARVIRELKAMNRTLKAIDTQLGYDASFPGPKNVRDSLEEICKNGREVASTC